MGAALRRARPEPCRPDCRGATRRCALLGPAGGGIAEIGSGNLERAGRATAAAQPRCTTGSGLGRRRPWRRGSASTPAGRSADLGSARAWAGSAGRADMGSATATATFDATTPASGRRSVAGSPGSTQLGRDTSAARAGVGCATTRSPQGPGASARSTPAGSSCRTVAAGADLGIAPRRGSAGRSCARSFMGFRATGSAGAQRRVDRLGSGCSQLSGGFASRAVLERARRSFLVGCAQDRGTCGSAGAIVGRSRELARAGRGLVGAFAG